MEKYEPIQLIQKSRLSGHHYDVLKFNELINELNMEQFDKFCSAIVSLTESYDSGLGAICTDQRDNVKDIGETWTVSEIDFD